MEVNGQLSLIRFTRIMALHTNIQHLSGLDVISMAEQLVKTLKHGLPVLFATAKHAQDWDEHLPCILFGYICGV
jgi:hypothetical protein